MREKGQTEVAKTLETPVFSRGIEILTEKGEFFIAFLRPGKGEKHRCGPPDSRRWYGNNRPMQIKRQAESSFARIHNKNKFSVTLELLFQQFPVLSLDLLLMHGFWDIQA